MLYDAGTLKPQLLIEEDIKNGEVGKFFWVINGEWGERSMVIVLV